MGRTVLPAPSHFASAHDLCSHYSLLGLTFRAPVSTPFSGALAVSLVGLLFFRLHVRPFSAPCVAIVLVLLFGCRFRGVCWALV